MIKQKEGDSMTGAISATAWDGKQHLSDPGWTSIASPEFLHIRQTKGVSYGAHQLWYSSFMGKMGGCGPTAASNLIWYLTASRPAECGKLFQGDGGTRAGMRRLMDEVWSYVKPGMRGVDKAVMLADGAALFGADHGVQLDAHVLEIPSAVCERPPVSEVQQFLIAAFRNDLPVAFLNLSNGEVGNLDNWHWVTLTATDGIRWVQMYDQGHRQNIDLDKWLDTTKNGGAFVTIEPVYS